VRGRIVFNGNFPDDGALPSRVAEWLLAPGRAEGPVLLVTAGWERSEYEEAHVKRAIHALGVPSRMVDGFDVNVRNLAAWHAYAEFSRREPPLAALWHARERLIETTRALYLDKNAFNIALLRRTLEHLRARTPHLRLAEILADETATFSHPPPDFDDDRLLGHVLAHDMRDVIGTLCLNDDRMVEILHVLDEHFAAASGLHYNPTWLELRARLEERVLSAASIFIFGGHLAALHRCLTFFRLRDAFREALRRGTTFFAVSAGALLLCERIIVYNDFASEVGPRREFQLFDRGFGLVADLQIFPHCMDRIQTDDADNLAYLAHRFQNRTCVGLNEESFLLVERSSNGGRIQATSVGRGDGVYVFDLQGRKTRRDFGEVVVA
jgi:peptidase E